MGAELVTHIYSCLFFLEVRVCDHWTCTACFFSFLNVATSAAIIITVIVSRVFYATLGILDVKTSRVEMFRSIFALNANTGVNVSIRE